jgi:hypothetical protein
MPPALASCVERSRPSRVGEGEGPFAVLCTIRSCRTIQHPDGNAGGAVEAVAALARSHGKGEV